MNVQFTQVKTTDLFLSSSQKSSAFQDLLDQLSGSPKSSTCPPSAVAAPWKESVIVEVDEKPVGIGCIIIEPKYTGRIAAHIEDVVVHKDYRGRGLGGRLIQELVRVGKQHRAYKVILNCSDTNVAFYEKCGFAPREVQMRLDL